MAHPVICPICKQKFDRDKIPFVKIGNRYAHETCANSSEGKSATEKDKIFQYIKSKVPNGQYDYVKMNKQMESYITQYGFTWSGMRGTLYYYFEIEHGEAREDTVGIIPYIYEKASRYFADIAKANEINKDVKISKPQEEVITIDVNNQNSWRKKEKRRITAKDWEELD